MALPGQDRLHNEPSTVIWGEKMVSLYKTVSHLPILEAVIRLRASLPRIGSANGDRIDETVTLANVSICPFCISLIEVVTLDVA